MATVITNSYAPIRPILLEPVYMLNRKCVPQPERIIDTSLESRLDFPQVHEAFEYSRLRAEYLAAYLAASCLRDGWWEKEEEAPGQSGCLPRHQQTLRTVHWPHSQCARPLVGGEAAYR